MGGRWDAMEMVPTFFAEAETEETGAVAIPIISVDPTDGCPSSNESFIIFACTKQRQQVDEKLDTNEAYFL